MVNLPKNSPKNRIFFLKSWWSALCTIYWRRYCI